MPATADDAPTHITPERTANAPALMTLSSMDLSPAGPPRGFGKDAPRTSTGRARQENLMKKYVVVYYFGGRLASRGRWLSPFPRQISWAARSFTDEQSP